MENTLRSSTFLLSSPGLPGPGPADLEMELPGARRKTGLGGGRIDPFVASDRSVRSVALVTTSKALVPSSFLLLLVRPGAPSSVRSLRS